MNGYHKFRCAILKSFLFSLFSLSATSALALSGLSEWEYKTNMGTSVSHTDGDLCKTTCLIVAPGLKGKAGIDHLRWWTHYPNFIVGESERFFAFDERTGATYYFVTERALDEYIKKESLGSPTSKRMNYGDGQIKGMAQSLCQTVSRLDPKKLPENCESETELKLETYYKGQP